MTTLAIHEAGHVVIDTVLGTPVVYAQTRHIDAETGALPAAHVMRADPLNCPMDHLVVGLLAGGEAERRATGQAPYWDVTDITEAEKIVDLLNTGVRLLREGRERSLAYWQTCAARLVARHWAWIRRVARALNFAGRLTASEIQQLAVEGQS